MPRSALFVLVVVVVAGLGAAVLVMGDPGSGSQVGDRTRVPAPAPSFAGVAGLAPAPARLEPVPAPVDRSRDDTRPLTVEPLGGHFGPDVPAAGRTAGLRPVVRRDGEPVAAEVTFVAGPEVGRVVAVAATDAPEPVEVYPGFAIVEVATADGDLCRRELLLDHRRTVDLDLDFAPRGLVAGRVLDEAGTPVAGARVSLDGVETASDREGRFRCPVLVSGEPLLHVRAPGFTPHRQALAAALPSDETVVALKRGSSLVLRLDDPSGALGSEPALLQLFPTGGPMSTAGGRVQQLFPWELVNPVRIAPGGQVTLEGLPPCRLEIVASHGRATTDPEPAYLIEGQDAVMTLTLKPLTALRGRVVRSGEAVAGAPVALRYANPIRATHRILGGYAKHARRLPVELLPQVAQQAVTDADGWFRFGLDDRIGKPPYVTVTAPSGELQITRRMDPGVAELVIDLARPGD